MQRWWRVVSALGSWCLSSKKRDQKRGREREKEHGFQPSTKRERETILCHPTRQWLGLSCWLGSEVWRLTQGKRERESGRSEGWGFGWRGEQIGGKRWLSKHTSFLYLIFFFYFFSLFSYDRGHHTFAIILDHPMSLPILPNGRHRGGYLTPSTSPFSVFQVVASCQRVKNNWWMQDNCWKKKD